MDVSRTGANTVISNVTAKPASTEPVSQSATQKIAPPAPESDGKDAQAQQATSRTAALNQQVAAPVASAPQNSSSNQPALSNNLSSAITLAKIQPESGSTEKTATPSTSASADSKQAAPAAEEKSASGLPSSATKPVQF
jgi:hypothetical protein